MIVKFSRNLQEPSFEALVMIERLPSDNLRLSLILVDGINASPSAKTRMGSHNLSASLRLRGGQRHDGASSNVRWSADINFPKHLTNANINALNGT